MPINRRVDKSIGTYKMSTQNTEFILILLFHFIIFHTKNCKLTFIPLLIQWNISHKKNEMLPFATVWKLEAIILSEIIWYLPFFNWLSSLSIIISRSIHAAAKHKTSFFLWPLSSPLCKCTTAFLFTQ